MLISKYGYFNLMRPRHFRVWKIESKRLQVHSILSWQLMMRVSNDDCNLGGGEGGEGEMWFIYHWAKLKTS